MTSHQKTMRARRPVGGAMQPGDLSATENLRLIQSRQEVGAVYQSALVLRPELICQFSGFSMVDVSPIHRATAADSS